MGKQWIDESGNVIPSNRITKTEKLAEKYTSKIIKTAQDLNNKLSELKAYIENCSIEIYEQVLSEKDIDLTKRKGNFTWFNFDRSVKIEVNIHENIQFDDILLSACKEKLNQFLDSSIHTEVAFVKQLVIDAFHDTKGNVDAKKVMNLLRYKSKIKNTLYREAMDILEESYRKVKSKMYTRVWVKDASGEYQVVDLNYSSVIPMESAA